ncbi:glycerate kinase [Streptococcus suis]|uniref:Glycerate kinase n=1 Tax=Streptococcus suis TaxID=1307 RepID=A0A4T2GMC7_STRSU|nr:glycerate kinase [Streptococcus suis]MBM7268786.1 glycerate kinase [Streptococcus suis]MBM7269500.1 glycerate kinase [Streptococcus suis]TII00266.1 glycerate kinase [Streptococcus suis]TII00838.1 glycerate kinase [Streptococcus suis]
MRILIAPDSFKESLSSLEVAEAICKGFSKVYPKAVFDLLPLGDGGEGTVASLAHALSLKVKQTVVTGPFGDKVEVSYAMGEGMAVFEMAAIVGLASIPLSKRNPLEISTKGIGELLVHLVQAGARQIYIGIGGSASHDGGIGMAAGLGVQFFDADDQELPAIGASLSKIARISLANLQIDPSSLRIDLITDVTNPLCGPAGATYTFAGQKGLSASQFQQVDQAMQSFYKMVNPAILDLPGAGAGGGMAAGLVQFAGAHIQTGIDFVLDQLDFDQRVAQADLVIVGEGRMDAQSLAGKTPVGVARRTPIGIPIIAICGSLKDDLPDFPFEKICAAFPIISEVDSLENTLENAEKNLIRTAEQVARILQLGGQQKWNL